MSRRRRELEITARERWPRLCSFLGCYFHEDRLEMYGSPENTVDHVISVARIEDLQDVLQEWRDWNKTVGWKSDVDRYVNDGLGVNLYFSSPLDARHFMNMVYDKVICATKAHYAALLAARQR